ncbi:FHA domain-containing protein [Trichocoleus sp. FACHB-90]|uniref:FHA domain-containing protein n=1 Tax=Cyanophyceae TaxID=3028117 RepID=UPI001686BA3F|nr:FHA domain-containing protein [Trichocoleus sp. FACHB-90]MBD1926788.1 FHA domain-containing protein [Trichocoleus sp. FACHB-90]
MNELTLEWYEGTQVKSLTINDHQIGKNPGTIRIGRDPARCDIVLTDPTVSGLHVEIFFLAQQQSFYLRSLRESNPPLVDGCSIAQGEVALSQGSIFYLGQMELKVTAVCLGAIAVPATIIMPPSSPAAKAVAPGTTRPNPSVTYGLQCFACNKVSPYKQLNLGCPWCGTSLAAALSVLVTPNGN